MIHESKPLSISEVEGILNEADDKEENKELKAYVKKFRALKVEKASKIRADIEKMESMMIKPEHIVKIMDLVPEDEEDVNKIFTESGLSKDETNKILEIIKKNK